MAEGSQTNPLHKNNSTLNKAADVIFKDIEFGMQGIKQQLLALTLEL